MSEHTGWVADAAYAAGYKDAQGDAQAAESRLAACRTVLADRERELLELKGPCRGGTRSDRKCRLHYAHSGPCVIPPAECPTCGPTTTEEHPHRPGVARCANCKEWLTRVIPPEKRA